MARSKTNIMVRIRRPKGWRFCKIVTGGGGKIKPEWAIVDGKEERHPEAKYFIDFLQDGKRIRRPAVSAADAVTMAAQQGQELIARKQAARAGIVLPEPESANGGRSLREAVDGYLLEIQAHKKKKTHSAYRTALTYFLESCRKQTLEEITRTDLLAFKTFLRDKKEQSDRSVSNKFENVMSFLKQNKITGLIGKTDWPVFTEEEVSVYTQEELDQFFAACNDVETLWFKTFYFTACREQEIMHLSWSDIDFERSIVTVRENKEFGFKPKAYKGRFIPISSGLLTLLKAWKEQSDRTCGLIFPTAGCKPKQNFLDECKTIAERAELNKDDFYLHKFRATRATHLLQGGMDVKSVQQILGHSDLASTLRYLGAQRTDIQLAQIEKIDA
jgi:integrase/recombinase XerD